VEPGEGLVSLATEQLSTLMAIKTQTTDDFFSISRIVLHRLLSTDIGDIIHYGYRYERVETLDTGGVRVHFANGHSADGDILVAADGINSGIRKQVFPEMFEPTQLGIAGIVAKVFLDTSEDISKTLHDVPQLKRGICVIGSTEGRGLFLASQIYSDDAKFEITKLFSDVQGVTHEAQLPFNATGENLLLIGGGDKKPLVDDARDYILCAYITKHVEDDLPSLSGVTSFSSLSQQDLLDSVVTQIQKRNWSRSLVELLKRTDVNTVGYWPLSVSPKVSDLSAHKQANITFVGDSIHTSTSLSFFGNDSATDRRRGWEYCNTRCGATDTASHHSCRCSRFPCGPRD
jgi:hypothetical protein